jgi:hypothetical protein
LYRSRGCDEGWRDAGWMILQRGRLPLEFFPHPELSPAESWFSCCLRVDDLPGFDSAYKAAGVLEQGKEIPRLSEPRLDDSGVTIAYLVDPDGTLLRLIQN